MYRPALAFRGIQFFNLNNFVQFNFLLKHKTSVVTKHMKRVLACVYRLNSMSDQSTSMANGGRVTGEYAFG